MRSPSTDFFHSQIERHILLAQSYTEIENLSFIIKSCRLKPYNILLNKNMKLILHRLWVDEFGNSLKIDKNKRVRIVYGDLSLDQTKIVCTDLYHGLSMEKVAKMSKLSYLLAGKDEDLYQDCFFLTFLGIDNYLRCYSYLYNEWHQVSPLILGMKRLKTISKNVDIKYFLELKNKDNMPIPCISVSEWITLMPPSTEFLSILVKQQETVSAILKG